MPTRTEEVQDLVRRWADAERADDAAAFGEFAAPGFRLVGPAGFVLGTQEWGGRYATGGLRTTAFDRKGDDVRDYGGCAVAIGAVTQKASHQGRNSDGQFRVTLVAVGDGGRLRICGLHYSTLARPVAG